MTNAQNHIFLSALQWCVDIGADEAWSETAHDRTAFVSPFTAERGAQPQAFTAGAPRAPVIASLTGMSEWVQKAEKLAQDSNTLSALREAISTFEGLGIKKTATQMVFADGLPGAHVMVIGEAPGADEDRQGLPFVGASGQLMDKILAAIDLSRTQTDPAKAVYISNILNWRPPGNRTPLDSEIAVSLPFIRRHIELAKPALILMCGAVSARALLGRAESISRLRGQWHDVMGIPALATYHPSYLLRTPGQKKAVWSDMLMFNSKKQDMGL
ncbi:MAG: uracil-DNA glycosylase [Alphaproteobacteria bacterium]|nr:uracil-DNA glycosylase [Alphaproteobacteria bacterium]